MANPFDQHRSTAPESRIDLRAWCEAQNGKRLFERMGRWYFVREVDGADTIDCIEGTDGANVRRLLAGNLPDFVGWSEARMSGYRRWLWDCARRGLTYEPRPQRQLEPA